MKAETILDIARGEIGYHEGANNNNKYGIEYGLNNQPWCVIFQWWCAKHAGADFFPNTAHCDGVRSFAIGRGRWVSRSELDRVQVGDYVIWDYDTDGSGDHIGIVESVGANSYTTIEGNYSDAVCRVTRTLDGVSGVYRPVYEDTAEDDTIAPAEDDIVTDAKVKFGDTGHKVKVVQSVLKLMGYNLGWYGVDGDFGACTQDAVRKFQAYKKLPVTGEVDNETLLALWEGD